MMLVPDIGGERARERESASERARERESAREREREVRACVCMKVDLCLFVLSLFCYRLVLQVCTERRKRE